MNGKLQEAKVGDVVAIRGGIRRRGEFDKGVIDHVTATQVCVGDARFMRASGFLVGDGKSSPWRSSTRAEPWTEQHDKDLIEQRAERRLHNSRGVLADHAWHKVTQEQANAVLAAMAAVGLIGEAP
jgi:hypothetical protein